MLPRTILCKIIYECNDCCPFCFESKFIKSEKPSLSFPEFKKNYYYLSKRFRIDSIILTGGEPTLHPNFLDMLKFVKDNGMGFKFITNLLKFNDIDFLKKLCTHFKNFDNDAQKRRTEIIASINDHSSHSLVAKERMQGLRNALSFKLPLMIIVVIYRENLKKLTSLGLELKDIINKEAPERKTHVEFRLMYVEDVEESLLKKSSPTDYNQVVAQIERLIPLMQDRKLGLAFWNFPLCYLKNYTRVENDTARKRQNCPVIKLSKDMQLDAVEIMNWESFLKLHPACSKCQIKFKCSGIERGYINKYNFPMPKAILPA